MATGYDAQFPALLDNGAPGVGKSAFAAQLTHTRGDTVIAAQFCKWDKPDHRSAPRVVRSLAFQLATRLPDYRQLLLTLPEIADLDRKNGADLFTYLLTNPLRSVIHGGRQRYLIVIDALDEAGEAGRNPLVETLARDARFLPVWLGLVVTSRPEFDVKTPLQALNPFPLDTRSESNRADVRGYLRRELASHLESRPDGDRLMEQILERSEGVFLYVERFCDEVQRGHLSLNQPERFPQGLGGIFCQYFQRQFPDLDRFRKKIRPALRGILAAREPLPIEILQSLFAWKDEDLRDFTRDLGSLFPVTTEGVREVIKPYHKSLADWLGDEAKAGPHFVSIAEGHRMLAEFGYELFLLAVTPFPSYYSRFLPVHLHEMKSYDELYLLMHDRRFAAALNEGYDGLPARVRRWAPLELQRRFLEFGRPGDVRYVQFDVDPSAKGFDKTYDVRQVCPECGYWDFRWGPCEECKWHGNGEERRAFDVLEANHARVPRSDAVGKQQPEDPRDGMTRGSP